MSTTLTKLGKMSRKDILSLTQNSNPIVNLLWDRPKSSAYWTHTFVDRARSAAEIDRTDILHLFSVKHFIKNKFGKPSNNFPDYESNPGVWLFKDAATCVTIIVYSDSHRKNAFKGTSVELAGANNLYDDVLLDLMTRFVAHVEAM
jgi:hypothetical protein